MPAPLDRRRFLASAAAVAAGAALPAPLAACATRPGAPPDGPPADRGGAAPLTTGDLATAFGVIGLAMPPASLARMLPDVEERLASLAAIRAAAPPNSVPPALTLDLRLAGEVRPAPGGGVGFTPVASGSRPAREADLAFAGVAELGGLLRARAVSSVELARLFLDRLRRFDPVLRCVVTLTEERALRQAEAMDAELAAGRDRGPLHGIPYGAKDLLAVAGTPTTWGTEPFRAQALDEDAAAVERMDAAGAVLVAKLSLGELAWGDVWFGGTTQNPWNVEEGASGSSAGPGAAVAAGLVPFALGSETLGSIVSPATRTGVTGLRPTYGRVATRGAMALSWSMDKLGPMTRSALDAALVFDALRGPDPRDLAADPDPAFAFDPVSDVRDLRVGYVEAAFAEADGPGGEADRATLDVIRGLGVTLRPVALPADVPADALLIVLEVEAAAAFDELTRSGGLDRMARQSRDSWPNVFRAARLIPAVEYVQANRLRTQLMRAMGGLMLHYDVVVSPSFGGSQLAITNLTGHPAVVVPNGFLPVEGQPERRSPHSVTFVGALWGEGPALSLAHAVQGATDWHRQRPPVA